MLWCICFFNYADRQAVFSVFPLLQREMRLTPVQLGMLGSAFAWVYGAGAPLAGWLVDRFWRKTAILGGLHAWSVICMATALSRSFRHLLFLRAAEGCGETFYYPASVSLISDYHAGRTRSRALGLLVTSVYVGTIGGGFFAGLIGQRYGWRWSFVVFGAMGVLLGAALQRFLVEPKRGIADGATNSAGLSVRSTLAVVIRTPAALLLMLAFVGANFVGAVLLSWMPAFLYERFHLSLAMAGLSATLFAQIASMGGALGGGWAADAMARRTPRGRIIVQMGAVFAGAPFVALCGLTKSAVWMGVGLAGWGLFKGVYDANIFAAPFDFIPSETRGSMAGLMNCVGWIGGGGVAPIVVGAIAQRTGLGRAIAATSIVYCIAGMVLALAASVSGRTRAAEFAPASS